MDLETLWENKTAAEDEMKKAYLNVSGRRIPKGITSEQIWTFIEKDINNLLNTCEEAFNAGLSDAPEGEFEEEADEQSDSSINEEANEDYDNFDDEPNEGNDYDADQDRMEDSYHSEDEEENQSNVEEADEFNQFMDEMEELRNENGDEENELEIQMLEEDSKELKGKANKGKKGKPKPDENEGPDAEELFNSLAYGTSYKNMERVEKKLIEKKEWQMRGEIRAMERPVNALLDVDVDFETGLQSKIVITKELNTKIETLIKQRIQDQAFDDRKLPTLPKTFIDEQSKALPDINFEKDKRGLVGVYEDQFKETVLGVNATKTKSEKDKDQIKELFKTICFCLDSMSRLNFTPHNSLIPKNKSGQNQIIFDEKVPVVVSSKIIDTQKAYKEIHDPKEKDLKSKVEMSAEEKRRLQRKIKITKKRVGKLKKEKERIRSGLSAADAKLLEKNKSKINKQIKDSKVVKADFTKSSTFFQTLNRIS